MVRPLRYARGAIGGGRLHLCIPAEPDLVYAQSCGAARQQRGGDPIAYYPTWVNATTITLNDINGSRLPYQGTTGVHGFVMAARRRRWLHLKPYMYGILGNRFRLRGQGYDLYARQSRRL